MSLSDSAAQRVENSFIPLDADDMPLFLVLPGLFFFAAFLLFPIGYLVFLSFTNADSVSLFTGNMGIVGLENYVTVLTDPNFWNSMWKTWLFVATSVLLKVTVALGIALVLTHEKVLGRRYLRSLIIIPMGLPGIFTITVWRGMFSTANYGLINQFIAVFGVEPVGWLTKKWAAFFAYNVTEVWLATPFMVIIIVSALQGVSEELHEAAMIDGAGYFSRFVHVTMPAIKKPVWFASILTAAASFQQFLIPYVFNKGGPARANELILVYGYREAFQFDKYGEGSAIMITAIVFIGMFMWLNVKKGRLADGVDEA